ncbi:Hsp20/alpha crystallin family protein [Cellulosimicrobium sp. Marseille-Q4280]|uniref:Hsp20/alpha crystallin family protein n=1 Tax=Cellulosimicrobium sp. Marseille-Q4280 TaxID=2937992 RepID=UPI00203D0494|nr:Hsp20/alpha crystallin family protein [Cellulosimicrobium sp. Marseille-Q4280]
MTTTLTPIPFGALAADRLVRDLWTRPAAPAQRSGYAPAADVYRDGDDLVARFDLPGVDPERDVTVELEGRRLVVRGERRDQRVVEAPEATDEPAEGSEATDGTAAEPVAEPVEKPVGRRIREVRFGEFRRTVTLPKAADADAVRASYDAGVLTVTVAGVFAGRAPQRIEVTRAA